MSFWQFGFSIPLDVDCSGDDPYAVAGTIIETILD
jgi:hypothetical protein